MSIRTWSLTRFWAVTAVCWLAAVVLSQGSGPLFGLVLAVIPAFLAGAWAGSHDEIRTWPVIRVVALWVVPAGTMTAAGDGLLREWKIAASIVLAPVAIFTVRWFELRRARPAQPELLPSPPREE